MWVLSYLVMYVSHSHVLNACKSVIHSLLSSGTFIGSRSSLSKERYDRAGAAKSLLDSHATTVECIGEREEQEEEDNMAATLLVSCNPNVNHACRIDNPSLPKSFMGVGHKIPDQTIASINQCYHSSQTKRSSHRFSVSAVSKGSAKSSKSDEKIPSWAKPDSEEPPPWAQSEGKKGDLEQGFEVPFYVYLLASAVTAIAAIGSVFEYVNDKPVFGVLYSDSIFYAPVLGFFAFTGIPTSAFLWFRSVQAANREAEEQDKRDGYR
ncbi:uncharacterized protein LOC126793623 isoform X2 [Argentina anserina]|uniref:uncharacterized protein LOC126793623 isoform X2 n=1 Tax=Argentina anserina TaxID=57926 RepID=UPI0021763F66|nr:uncharacterized protein LOC126793623 isoform X2 [Potentilla anserina]